MDREWQRSRTLKEPVANFRVFRVYLINQKHNQDGSIITFYWDTADKRQALMDPYFYLHMVNDDTSSRVGVLKVTDANGHLIGFSWQRIGDEEKDLKVGNALIGLDESRRQDLQKFLGECWESVERAPHLAFGATFR
jgi:hypothetical protein